jgi:hypothetical protein
MPPSYDPRRLDALFAALHADRQRLWRFVLRLGALVLVQSAVLLWLLWLVLSR